MPMRQSTERALNEIDAAMFSGDDFISHGARETLRQFMKRWEKALKDIERDHD